MPEPYILDASVIVKFLNQTNELEALEAADLLYQAMQGKVVLFSIDLVVHEVLNALVCSKKLREEKLHEALVGFWSLPLQCMVVDEKLTQTAAVFATAYGITVYDAVYLALAFDQDMPLITANPKHQKPFGELQVLTLTHWKKTIS